MKTTTRLRILDHIRKQRTASVRELSRVMGMTGANIRHHLALLESNDLIEVITQRKEGRGRPGMVYGLSRHALGDGLDKLSAALLVEWFGELPEKDRQVGLRSLASRIGADSSRELEGALPIRLSETIRFLNGLHYQARWEAGAAGAHVILGHCPFSAIIEQHPELCQMDAFLLEENLGLSVEQTSKLEGQDLGMPQCVFLIN